jgi:Tfp pilus assembly protein PilN
MLRHIPLVFEARHDLNTDLSALGREVRRLVSVLPGSGSEIDNGKLLVWNAAEINPEALKAFEQSISMQVDVVNGAAGLAFKKSVRLGEAGIGRFAAAISLASAAGKSKLLGIDFLNSHIHPEKKAADGRRIMRAVLVGLAVVLCGLFLILSWHNEKAEIAVLRTRLDDMKQDITEAEAVINKVSFSRGWYSARPKFLDCLKQLTLALPAQTSIWVTSLAMREDMQANVTGKSLDESSVLQFLDALKSNASFSNVEMLYMRNIGRSTKEVSFAISFTFIKGS